MYKGQAESYEAWAGGYLDGMEMSEDEWFEYAESDEEAEFLVTHLWPIDILSGLAAQEADEVGDPWPPEGMTVEEPVSYTPLTLPTRGLGEFSGVAGSLKKKTQR